MNLVDEIAEMGAAISKKNDEMLQTILKRNEYLERSNRAILMNV